MLRAEFFDGVTTYYWATEPLDYGGKIWEPRISKDFAIPRVFSHTDKFGSRKRTISLTLDNRDQFFNGLVYDKDVTPLSPGMLNQRITLYYDDGANKTKKFVGRIAEIGSFGLDVQLTLSENLYSYLDDPYPDAQIAYDYYSDQGINESWNAIPICFGQVERLKVMWIDKVDYRFMVCVGPIYQIDKIYFNKTVMYEAGVSNGYQSSPTAKNIKVRIFKGTGSVGSPEVVDTITSLYPGMCYIEFYDEATGLATAPMLVDNEVPEIFVDLKGIANDSNTGAERNPAKILYKMYTNPRTGYNGWGLGISAADVNFTQAITDCTTRAYCIDGVISEKQTIGNWTDAILKCMAGRLEEDESGVLRLYIDGAKSSIQAAFDETGETGYNIVLGPWSEPPIESQINRLRVFYDKNQETGKWNRKPDTNQESPIGSPYLADSAHAGRILRWNTGTLELPLVRDDITADKLAQLYFKRDIQQLKTVTFDTEVDVLSTLDIDQLITITSPKYGWVAKQFTILEITKSQKITTIKAQEYSSAAYTYQSTVPPTAPSRTYYSAYDIPEIPQSFTMNNNGTGLQADGTFKAFVNLAATMPRMGVKLNWYYKCHTNPDWIFLGQTDQTSQTLQWNQNSGNYDFTVNATSAIGNSGQYGSCITCCLTTDTLPNDAPGLSAVAIAMGLQLTINFDETAAVNKDFNHFVLQQSQGSNIWTTVDSNLRAKSVVVPSQNYSALSCFRVFAVDNSGNCSATSSDTAANSALQVVGADITNQPIVGKTFQTANTVCAGCPGVVLDPTGLSGYSASKRTFFIDAATGNATFEGTICATAGNIGGFCADPTEGLYAGTGVTRVQMKAGAGFWAGATAQGSAPFSVDQAGNLTSSAGSIAGWCLNTGCIYKCGLVLDSTGSIYSSNYVSNNTGWKIDCLGNAEFGNASIRGSLHSVAFTTDEVHAVGGNLLVANSGKLKAAMTATGTTFYMCPEDPVTGHSQQFAVNDVIRVKTLIGAAVCDLWASVVSADDCTTYYRYTMCYKSGTNSATYPAGTAVVSYGPVSTGGGIEMVGAGSGISCAPYLDVFSNTACPWSGNTTQVRLGNLSGIPTLSGYGLYTNNGNIYGGIVRSTVYNTDCGTCIDLTNGTFAFGGSNANGMCWNGTTLTMKGTICASFGNIGGWCIAADALYSACSGFDSGWWTIWSGETYANKHLAKFAVRYDGAVFIRCCAYFGCCMYICDGFIIGSYIDGATVDWINIVTMNSLNKTASISMSRIGEACTYWNKYYICFINGTNLTEICAAQVKTPLLIGTAANGAFLQGPNYAVNTNGGTELHFYSCLSGSWAVMQKFCSGCVTFPYKTVVNGTFSGDSSITAGTCVVTGSIVTTSLGSGNYLCLSGSPSGSTVGAHIWLQNNAHNAYINNDEADSIIYLRGYVSASCCVAAGTCVTAPIMTVGALYTRGDTFHVVGANTAYVGMEFGNNGSGASAYNVITSYNRQASTFHDVCFNTGSGKGLLVGGCVTAGTCVVATTGLRAKGIFGSEQVGPGAEIQTYNGTAYFQGYDRTAQAYIPVYITGSSFCFTSGAISAASSISSATRIVSSMANGTAFEAPDYAVNTNGGTEIHFYSRLSGSWLVMQKFCNGCVTFPYKTVVNGTFHTDTSIAAGTCVTAGTYVNATGDIYSGGWGRFTGWNANSGSLSGFAVEIGASGGISYIQSYNRTNSTYCPLRLDAVSVCSISPFIATINCSTGVAGLFQACNSNTSNGAYASISLCAGSCVGQIWLDNQNTTGYNGAGGLNIYGYAAVSLWGGGSETLRATASCVCVCGTLGCTSSRTLKHDYTDVSVLPGLRNIAVQAWRFRSGPQDWRIGPYAEDIAREWPWLTDGHTIHSMDGIALRGIQELDTRLTDELDAMRRCINDLEKRLPAAA